MMSKSADHNNSDTHEDSGGVDDHKDEKPILRICPGYTIPSPYEEPAVLLFCKFVVQADVVMLALQILWGIIYGSMTATHTDASIFVVDFVLTISITLCSLVLSIEGVKHRNPELYFGMGYFEFCAAWHAVGCLFKVAFLIINIFEGTIFAIVFDAIFFVFYCIGYYRCRELLSLLYMPQNIKKTSEMESESAEHKEADNAV